MAQESKKNAVGKILGFFKRLNLTGQQVRTIICIALLLVLFICVPIFVNTAIGYIPLIGLVLTLAICFGYLQLQKRGLTFETGGIGDGCIRGENIAFKLAVKNDCFLPATRIDVEFFISDLFGATGSTAHRSLTLPPKNSKEFDFGVRFDHIGTYTVGIKQLVISDPLGIFSTVLMNENMSRVSVKPRLFDIEKVEIGNDANNESKKTVTTVINEGMDYCGVREYVWGDPIKTIHWKLSARMQEEADYFTRLYETACNPGVEVFVDLESLSYDSDQLMGLYDTVVESAFSIERWASMFGLESLLSFSDEFGNKRRFEGPFHDVYDGVLEEMPRISVGDGLDLLDLLKTESSSIYAPSNLIVCSSCITDQLVGELISIKAGKRTPLLFAAIPAQLDEEEMRELRRKMSRLSAANVAYVLIEGAADLERMA